MNVVWCLSRHSFEPILIETMVYKELLSNCSEQYEKVRVLLETEGKNDPEDVPYKSKYAAKEILKCHEK